MLKTLNVARGAVSAIDLIPAMRFFYINGPQIQATNGRITIDAWGPDTGIQALVPAERFLKAIGDGESKLVFILDGSKLVIKKGRLRVTINTLPLADFPIVDDFDGDPVQFDEGLLVMLRRLVPFIANDASRPWANSVMIRDGYAYATSNPLLARIPFDTDKQIILPTHLITEMLRIGETPTELLVTQGTVSVIYDTFRIRAQQVIGEWPTQLVALIACLQAASVIEVPAGLLEAVEELKPFFPDPKIPVVEFGPEGVSTKEGIHCAMVEQCGLPVSIYRYESLITMLSVATHADFNAYPSPVPFRGDGGIEGMLCGLRPSTNV